MTAPVAGLLELAQARRRAADAEARAADLERMVRAFVAERPGYVRALRAATSDVDYHRYAGNAEARRDLARRLGWPEAEVLA